MSDPGARRPGALPLDEALRAACAPGAGCPPPEAYLELAEDGVSEAERRRLAEHAAGCPACAAEWELARAFAGPAGRGQEAEGSAGRGAEGDLEQDPGRDPERDADVAAIVSRLEALDLPRRGLPQAGGAGEAPASSTSVVRLGDRARSRSAQQPAPRVRPGRRWGAPPMLRLALAATLAVALGWMVYLQRAPEPPPLTGGPISGAVRGGEVAGLVPQGELPELPVLFSWDPVPGARAYRVTLRAVDDVALWQQTVAVPRAALPGGVRERLHPTVDYMWSVEALGQGEEILAASGRVSFRAQPTREKREAE